MNMIFALLGLIPGIQVVFRFGVELTERDFMELTPGQYDANQLRFVQDCLGDRGKRSCPLANALSAPYDKGGDEAETRFFSHEEPQH